MTRFVIENRHQNKYICSNEIGLCVHGVDVFLSLTDHIIWEDLCNHSKTTKKTIFIFDFM